LSLIKFLNKNAENICQSTKRRQQVKRPGSIAGKGKGEPSSVNFKHAIMMMVNNSGDKDGSQQTTLSLHDIIISRDSLVLSTRNMKITTFYLDLRPETLHYFQYRQNR
jgi:hypothetical protein